jgi:hypothetical protein
MPMSGYCSTRPIGVVPADFLSGGRRGSEEPGSVGRDRRAVLGHAVAMQLVSGELGGIDYHQFYFVADSDENVLPEGAFDDELSPNTLIVPTGHALCVSTGIAMGVLNLTVEVLDAAPPAIDDHEAWQAVSEVSFEATSDNARIQYLMDWTSPPFDHFQLPAGKGWYRARAHAVGRSLDFDLVVSENPREKHLLQLWRSTGPETATHHRVDNRWADQGF